MPADQNVLRGILTSYRFACPYCDATMFCGRTCKALNMSIGTTVTFRANLGMKAKESGVKRPFYE
jgi:hypothetical protein